MNIISGNLDVAALHDEYMDTGAVVVKGLLAPDVAELVYESLEKHVPWELHVKRPKTGKVAIYSHEEVANLTDKEKLKLAPRVATLKDNDLSFIYNRFTIPTNENETTEELLILTRVFRYFNSPEYKQLMGDITGDYSGLEVSTWASRYDQHHHLSIHMDESPTQGRIAAHVLGLTKGWEKEWGGNFAFCDENGKPVDFVVPQFNSLVLFKVPRLHLVTQIKSYAKGHRYSLFGWYKATKNYFKETGKEDVTPDFRQRWF